MREARRYSPEEIHKRAPWLFKPGNRANTTGRPAQHKHITALCREFTEAAVLTLVHIMTRSRATDSEKRACALALLERGWGQTPRSLAIFSGAENPLGGPLPAGTMGSIGAALTMDTKVQILMAVSERGADALLEFQDELPTPAPNPASEEIIDLIGDDEPVADLVG